METTVWILAACIGAMIGGGLFAVATYVVHAIYKVGFRHGYALMEWFLTLEHGNKHSTPYQRQVAFKMSLLVLGMIALVVVLNWMKV